MSRPGRLVLIAGTGTEVGKTWVAAALLRELRGQGRSVAARKPAQSFDPVSGEPTDAQVLAAATGEDVGTVCPAHRSYETPMAPPMAAEALDRPAPTLHQLVSETVWPSAPVDVGLVEAAGGVRSPLAIDGDTVDLARRLAPDLIVLVADAGLGTINLVRLATAALDRWPVLVLLNRFDEADPLHTANRAWLGERDGLHLVTSPAAAVPFVTQPIR